MSLCLMDLYPSAGFFTFAPMQQGSNYTWLLLCVVLPALSQAAIAYECTMQKLHEETYCVFRNVVYDGSTAAEFKSGAAKKVQQVAFEDSSLVHLPKELLSAFPDLRALYVAGTNLTTVVIPSKLERLYASNNYITKVIVHQAATNTPMTELMLDSNRLRDISNLTRLTNLEILNLSGNEELAKDSTIDLGDFGGLTNLRHLLLSDVGAFYVENERDVSLPELELLDLSNNNLVTTNLVVKVFAPLRKLKILRLAHDKLTDLDAMGLTKNNDLAEIYLEGNDFPCDFQARLLEHFQKAQVETPVVHKQSRCMLEYEKQNDMCCRSTFTDKSMFTTRPNATSGSGVVPTNTRGNLGGITGSMDQDPSTTTTTRVPMTPKVGSIATITLGNSLLSLLGLVVAAKLIRF
ncbi:toll-like receptor 6 [Anopheles cruzii]|uniref:toll-like receptor 6 n=1 Tax=Anopheles cruzii TaxID=68878 RepID=UPI0022EC6129|nr:toll-like receptor 6 [Anopheles cruzii]